MIREISSGGDGARPMGAIGTPEPTNNVWFNRRTGKTILVREPIMDGENMYMMTGDGQLIDMNTFSENYIQMSNDVYDANGNKIGTEAVNGIDIVAMNNKPTITSTLPPMVSLDEPISKKPKNVNFSKNEKSEISQKGKKNDKSSLIEKIVTKNKPQLDVTLKWDNAPTNELRMLIDYFDITLDDIKSYLHSTIEPNFERMDNEIDNLLGVESTTNEN